MEIDRSAEEKEMKVPPDLSILQRRQAALLYLYASKEFLEELDEMANRLMRFADNTLSTARNEHRDQVLADAQWGARNTSENWAKYAWPFLHDFKRSLLTDIANRAIDHYQITGTNQFIRGSSEYSLQWTTPNEYRECERMMNDISHHGSIIDGTMTRFFPTSSWDDFGFAMALQEHGRRFTRLPRFRIRTDVEGVTDAIPPRTGVYIPQDDVHGAMQFAWHGVVENRRDGRLLECATFNDIGLHALQLVGRSDLWLDVQKMFDFAMLPKYSRVLRKHLHCVDEILPELGHSAVARHAFKSRACKWYFVEMIEGEFDDIDDGTISAVIDEPVLLEAIDPQAPASQ